MNEPSAGTFNRTLECTTEICEMERFPLKIFFEVGRQPLFVVSLLH